MKKIFLFCLVLIVLPSIVKAQFGIKAGVNLSYINGNNDIVSNRESRVGFEAGLMYKIPVKEDWLSIQPELLYIQKGGVFNINQISIEADLDYIEIPVLLVYNLLGGVLAMEVGPQFSFLTKVNYQVYEDNNPTFTDTDLDNYNLFDFGLTVGIGLELEIVMIELRYSIGFLEIEKGFTYGGQFYDPSSNNFNVQFLVGYIF